MEYPVKVHSAFVAGDYDLLNALAGSTPGFPDCHLDGFGHCLEYAIYHSPLPFIKQLMLKGADPNYGNHAGFPSIIAALSSGREDTTDIIDLLLDHGADINQHGHNDWTPLHWAAAGDDAEMIRYLLDKGADPEVRTGIDDKTTPLEEARLLGCEAAVEILRSI